MAIIRPPITSRAPSTTGVVPGPIIFSSVPNPYRQDCTATVTPIALRNSAKQTPTHAFAVCSTGKVSTDSPALSSLYSTSYSFIERESLADDFIFPVLTLQSLGPFAFAPQVLRQLETQELSNWCPSTLHSPQFGSMLRLRLPSESFPPRLSPAERIRFSKTSETHGLSLDLRGLPHLTILQANILLTPR